MRLQNKRLILREWHNKDIQDLIEGLNDLTVSRWLPFVPHPYTKKDAQNWIKFCSAKDKNGNARTSYHFAIELKSEKKVIGGVSLGRIDKSQGLSLGGGIWINSKYHGYGYGKEAFEAKIKFAFNKLKLRRLENGFLVGNLSSFKMQKRLGYKVEGLKRKAFKCMADGKIRDEKITGLLKEDWERKELERE